MTMQELEQVKKSMQQQWYDLVIAEQQDEPLETLEQMYDRYILLAEEYNSSSEAYQREQEQELAGRAPASRGNNGNNSKKQHTFLAREKARGDIKLAS